MWTCAGVVLALIARACSITRDQFYPFGPQVDLQLPHGQEIVSPETILNVPIIFYGEQYDSIYVNNFGVLSFRSEITSFINAEFPLPYASIAAFYTNVDTTNTGTVYYRETNETRVLVKAEESVLGNFLEYYEFKPTSVFIATWIDVSYNSDRIEKKNTFQVAIISNGSESFVELLYPEREIQWIQGESQGGSLPDAKAQAGFVAEDGRVFSLRGSGSHQIRNIVSWSNTHEPGKYVFRIGVIPPDGNIAVPDQYNENEVEDEEESKTCAQSGPSICHIQARCVDYQAGICCQCNDGYYGNGKSCIKNDVPLRVHGKLFGEINRITLNDATIQAYVVVADGRSYAALSQVPTSLGRSLQSLNVLGGVIGWLFAQPIGNAKNGYQLTGSLFNHTAEIFFPSTGDRVTVRQEFLGHDVFDQITLETDIRGTIPVIEVDDKLALNEYEEQYTFVESGVIRSQSTLVFVNKKTNVQFEENVSQTFSFSPCRYAPTNEDNTTPSTLKVTKNYLGYEERDNIVRYGMSNKITTFGEEDPCVKGRITCTPNSACVVDGNSFKCICNTGYTSIYQSDGEACIDIDECTSGTHNCDINADCYNYNGGFTCRCKSGYEGNGVTCNYLSDCSSSKCDHNAQCIQNYGELTQCVCNPGFTGNGEQCWPIRESTCEVLHNCSPNANCVYSPAMNSYICQCSIGFGGDGYYCSEDVYTTSTQSNEADYNDTFVLPTCTESQCLCPTGYSSYVDERGNSLCHKNNVDTNGQFPSNGEYYNSSGILCSNDDNCPPNAKCLFSQNSQTYECQCPAGYEGDGYECTEKVGLDCADPCGSNAHCIEIYSNERMCMCDVGYHGDGYLCRPNLSCTNNSDCEYNAECRFDQSSGENVCQCIDGYSKDQNDACIVAGQLCSGALCTDHASCLWDSSLGVNYCQCDPGYEGEGIVGCVEKGYTCDVTNDCSPDAVCRKTYDSSYKCVCKDGFIGNGYSCAAEPNCRNQPYLCDSHASCLVKSDGYICECNSGYNGNGSFCQPNPRQPGNFLIVSSGMFINKIPFEPSPYEYATPINSGLEQIAVGLDVDCQTGRIYWGDVVSNTIKSSAYDGSSMQQFLSTDIKAPEGLAIDWVSRNIYWTDSKKLSIEVANIDTKVRHILFSHDRIVNPRGIAVHPQKGKLFWSDWDRMGPKIEWSNLDGSGREIFLGGGNTLLPNSLAIDWTTDRLCYADAGFKSIECVDIDSRQRETVAANCSYPFGLTITDDKFYWTDWRTSKIENIDKRTLAKGTLPIATSGGRLYGITVARDNCLNLENVCMHNRAHCGHDKLCLPNGHNGRTCL